MMVSPHPGIQSASSSAVWVRSMGANRAIPSAVNSGASAVEIMTCSSTSKRAAHWVWKTTGTAPHKISAECSGSSYILLRAAISDSMLQFSGYRLSHRTCTSSSMPQADTRVSGIVVGGKVKMKSSMT